MESKTFNSKAVRLKKTPDKQARRGYRADWLGDAAGKVQQMSQAQFHGLLEENPDTIIIVDQTGCINLASNRIEGMLGYLPGELFGEPLSVLIPVRHRVIMRVIWLALCRIPDRA